MNPEAPASRGAAPSPRQVAMGEACRTAGLLALYLFGSRAEDGLRALAGETVDRNGSDIDVGVVFDGRDADLGKLPLLQVALEDALAPLRVDIVPLQRVDGLFQFSAIDGHRVFAGDGDRADMYELVVMRKAAELIPIQRQIERDLFGVTNV